MLEVLKFFVWSDDDGLGWLFGMAVRAVFWLVLLLVALAVVNPNNPAYNPADRAGLEAEIGTFKQTGTMGNRWSSLLHSASVECHYKSSQPQEFIVSGTLPDEYIVPRTGAVRWYIRFSATLLNLVPNLLGMPRIEVNIVTMGEFYNITNNQGFKACTRSEALRVHNILRL